MKLPCTALFAAAALAAGLALASTAALAQASGNAEASTRVHRNVYAGGGEVRSPGPVKGDFIAAGGRVFVDQPVDGDAMLAGGAVDVRAAIGDDLRAAGGDVTIDSRVGGELFATGGSVNVRPGTIVSGMARLYGASVTMEGRLDGGLSAGAQKVIINGEVRGDTTVTAEDVELGPNARITGALRYTSANELRKADTAVVTGTVTRQAQGDAGERRPGERAWGGTARTGTFWAGGVFSFLAILACAAVFLLVAPVFGVQAPERIRQSPWLALAIGFASLVAVPMLAVLLFITLLGIPLGIAVMALYPVLLLAGFIVGVRFVAGLLPGALRQPAPGTFARTMAWFAGALLLMLVIARIPLVGALAMGLISLAGIGACVLELYARRRRPGTPATPGGGTVGKDTGEGAFPPVLS